MLSSHPLVAIGVAGAFLLVLILWLRCHAFIALLGASLGLVSILIELGAIFASPKRKLSVLGPSPPSSFPSSAGSVLSG